MIEPCHRCGITDTNKFHDCPGNPGVGARSSNPAALGEVKATRRVDKMFPTNQGFICFMTDGTVYMYDGSEGWRFRCRVPQDEPTEEKPSGIIG